ncbi:MAG: hypothetical protein N2999_05180 [Proteobacteria bacterium]|nr:hypothetical protein [Pseudomonadota bacterium]
MKHKKITPINLFKSMALNKGLNRSMKNTILEKLRVLFLLLIFFLNFSAMKVMLKDGNFVEVSGYKIFNDFIRIEIKREKIDVPIHLIDIKSTLKLLEIESRGFSVLKGYSSLFYQEKVNSYSFSSEDKKKDYVKSVPKIKLETRKETNPFFMELPDQKFKDEDFIERIKKKGIFLKFNIPVKQ